MNNVLRCQDVRGDLAGDGGANGAGGGVGGGGGSGAGVSNKLNINAQEFTMTTNSRATPPAEALNNNR